ncbi:lysozyme family protein [Novosphingobium sp. SG751A]|uniref:glycosyl hydrolase 108 family protein n=1 Tax=Novosphingobium sp. SG751A TaxID=2587000 RepID=UPI0015524504|nr:glycosyl hydrolase 108 family protein [Novosphingobium sp. SG751A]NOW44123.1 lysozyme family protein [Novosphingobium sp. SG751A]
MASKPATARKGPRKPIIITAAMASILMGVYAHEGGYVNNKLDRGGATRWGVTEKVARQWGYLGDMRSFPKHCSAAEPVCADQIYAGSYMADPGALAIIDLSPAITAELVDTGVNMGSQRPLPWFREGLNALGGFRLPVTSARLGSADVRALAGLRARKGGLWTCVAMLDYLDARQRQRYDAIVRNNPSQQVFYQGWISLRIGNVDRRECRKEAI